ncbi:MAG: thiamine pyrophosphate-dependent dehydrogenase E1 component subunit alpha [Armatimonadia bacterium]
MAPARQAPEERKMPEAQLQIDMLRRMYRIRHFEERLRKFYDYRGFFAQDTNESEKRQTADLLTSTMYDFAASGMIGGAVHLYIGEEAVGVGVCTALRKTDYVTSSHRDHGHFLAKGGNVMGALAELMGRSGGVCRGCGGSMHLYQPDCGFLGGNGIIGGQIPLALGPAFAAKYRGEDGVSVAFFGDGATNEGTLYESMNLASTWKLPVLFVCENNLYAATTPARIAFPTADIAPRAEGFAMPAHIVDGQDVLAVHEVAQAAVERARAGDGPTFIEAKTYRFRGHCGSVAEHAFPEECARWQQRDPITLLAQKLEAEGLLAEDDRQRLEADVIAEIDAAEHFAVNSPLPTPDMLQEFLN